LLLPDDGVTVIHEASSLTVQLELDVTFTVLLPEDEVNSRFDLDKDKLQIPDWLTAISFVVLHPVTVTVPLRCEPLFAETETVKVPLLLPDAGETVIHEASSLTVQLELEFIVTDLFPAVLVKSILSGNTDRLQVEVTVYFIGTAIVPSPPSF
jgi:hypothetical protein